jgi:hypothetical protein
MSRAAADTVVDRVEEVPVVDETQAGMDAPDDPVSHPPDLPAATGVEAEIEAGFDNMPV